MPTDYLGWLSDHSLMFILELFNQLKTGKVKQFMFHRPTSPNDQPAPAVTAGAQAESKTMTQNNESGESQADRSVDIPASPFQPESQKAAFRAGLPLGRSFARVSMHMCTP